MQLRALLPAQDHQLDPALSHTVVKQIYAIKLVIKLSRLSPMTQIASVTLILHFVFSCYLLFFRIVQNFKTKNFLQKLLTLVLTNHAINSGHFQLFLLMQLFFRQSPQSTKNTNTSLIKLSEQKLELCQKSNEKNIYLGLAIEGYKCPIVKNVIQAYPVLLFCRNFAQIDL